MIKNLIFDFGGILLDLNFKRTDEAFKKIFNIHFEGRAYPEKYMDCFIDYEVGSMPEVDFVSQLSELAKIKNREKEILDAWNGMLVQIPMHRLEMLMELRKDYKVFLLSNTNYTHINWVHEYLPRTYGISDFEERFFDKVYYSHAINMRKPNADIYEFVLEDAGLSGAESLFIDDTEENVIAARNCGIHSSLHRVEDEIGEKIGEYINKV